MIPTGKIETAIDDRALLAAAIAGDHSAMERLYDRHSPMVFAVCLRVLRERSSAEELLNDVFMELWRRGDRFDPARGSVLTYLLTLTRSRAIDRLRAGRRHAAVPLDEQLADGVSDDAPLQHVAGEEERQRVAAALQQLSGEQRAALELAYFEDLSHSQIAERLAKPLGTVKTHIRQGLIQLRDILRTLNSDPSAPLRPGKPS